MTTLAGRKLRQFRERQSPRLTRRALAERLGVAQNNISGWECEGKRPDSAEVVNRLAADGIAAHRDWFLPAVCSLCSEDSDHPEVPRCSVAGCPLRIRPLLDADHENT